MQQTRYGGGCGPVARAIGSSATACGSTFSGLRPQPLLCKRGTRSGLRPTNPLTASSRGLPVRVPRGAGVAAATPHGSGSSDEPSAAQHTPAAAPTERSEAEERQGEPSTSGRGESIWPDAGKTVGRVLPRHGAAYAARLQRATTRGGSSSQGTAAASAAARGPRRAGLPPVLHPLVQRTQAPPERQQLDSDGGEVLGLSPELKRQQQQRRQHMEQQQQQQQQQHRQGHARGQEQEEWWPADGEEEGEEAEGSSSSGWSRDRGWAAGGRRSPSRLRPLRPPRSTPSAALQRRAREVRAADWGPKEITLALNGCTSVADVNAIWLAYSDRPRQLNYRHYTAAVQALARVAGRGVRGVTPQERAQATELLERIKPHLQREYTRLRPRNVAVLINCLAALGSTDRPFIGDLLHVALPLLPDFAASELACVLHALPRLRMQPTREWMAAFYSATDARWAEFNMWGLSSIAWALGALRKRPPPDWLEGFCDAADARWEEATPQGVANIAWGLAAARAQPAAPWMRRLVRAATEVMGGFTPQGAANVTWALAKLSFRPDNQFVLVLLGHTQPLLSTYNPQELSAQAYALAALGVRPGRGWMDAFFEASAPRLEGTFGSQAMSNTLWALARMERAPPLEWLSAFLSASHLKLQLFNPQALATTLWSLARLRVRPRGAWVDAAVERAYALLPLATPVEVVIYLMALVELGPTLPQRWLNRFYEESLPKIPAFTAVHLSTCLYSLARAARASGHPPPPAWTAAAMAALNTRLRSLDPARLADTLWALSELGLQPTPELLDRFEEAAADKLLALSPPPRLARAVATLARLGRAPDGAALLLAMDDLAPRALPADALGDLLWALARMRFRPEAPWLHEALQQVLSSAARADASGGDGSSGSDGSGSASASPQHWARSLEGLAGLGARPGADWALAAARATRGLMGDLSGEQLLVCLRALSALAPDVAGEVAALLGVAPAAAPGRQRQHLEGAVAPALPQHQHEQQQHHHHHQPPLQQQQPPQQPPGSSVAPPVLMRPVLKRPVLRKPSAR